MKKLIAVASILLFISYISKAATYPYQPTQVQKFISDGEQSDNMTRLRLAVSLDEGGRDESLKIGDLILCSATACYMPPVSNYISVKSTAKGEATVVFDSFVPPDVINAIYFSDVAGSKVVVGKIELAEPLKLEKGFQGGDIMVLLKKTLLGKVTRYKPVQAVSALMDSEAQAVYYNPNFSSSVSLPLGVTLDMPAGALAKPQIFSIAVRDTGGAYPTVDMYPYLNTQKEFTVSAPPQSFSRSGEVTPVAALPTADVQGKLSAQTARLPVTKKFTRTANLKLSQTDKELTTPHPNFLFHPYDTECSSLLKKGGILSAVEKVIGYSGAVYVGACASPAQTFDLSGELELSQSASASSILVCHPGPVARKRLTISDDSRMVMRSFTAAFCGPRSPGRRFKATKFSYVPTLKNSFAGFAC